jgi:5-methylcytosine-specific restriction protein A
VPLPRPCLDCGVLISSGSRCRRHGSTTARGYGGRWTKISKQVLRRDGYRCQLRLPGCSGLATTTDHVIPKARGGTDDPSNLAAACRSCNSAKRDR